MSVERRIEKLEKECSPKKTQYFGYRHFPQAADYEAWLETDEGKASLESDELESGFTGLIIIGAG